MTLAEKYANALSQAQKPWWRDDNPQVISANPALMTGTERVLTIHMRQLYKAMDEVVAEDIADSLRRLCERYAGDPEWPMAVAVARELRLA